MTVQEYQQWLDSLKVGDKVALVDCPLWEPAKVHCSSLGVVVGITKSRRFRIDATKLGRSFGVPDRYPVSLEFTRNGHGYGENRSWNQLAPTLPEYVAKYEAEEGERLAAMAHERNANRLRDVRWKDQPSAVVTAVIAILDAQNPKPGCQGPAKETSKP
jgi:hypothetical protein